MKLHISRGISKLGADIPSINLPPVITCRCEAPCASSRKCYAMKGRFAFPHNKNLLQGNLDLWHNHPKQFEIEVIATAFHNRFMRWHSSGDIPDPAYLEMMIRVAKALPNTKFLCFTKRYEWVNAVMQEIPQNLQIVLSAWGDWHPDNPFNLPVAHIRFRKTVTNGIPQDARICPKYCGDCVMTGCSCWDLKPGESVVFDEH